MQADMILSQSIAVVLFHLDNQPHIADIDVCRQKLGKSPWRFHHVTELNTKQQSSHKVHTRQEFHEVAKDLPLFSIGSVHNGLNIIRFNIFTRKHTEMVEFYSKILDTEPQRVRNDFYLFRLQRAKNVEVQFALKSSTKIVPYPTDKAQLVFRIKQLPSKMQTESVIDDSLSTRDPDSNNITLILQDEQQSSPAQICPLVTKPNKEKTSLHTEPALVKPSIQPIPGSKLYKAKLIEISDSTEQRRQRPDVIPRDDHVKLKQPASPTLIRLGNRTRTKSPSPRSRKLNITTQSANINSSRGKIQLRDHSALKKRESVDIVMTF